MGTMMSSLKNLILQNQESYEAESWYIVLGTQGLPNIFNDDPRMTFNLLTAQSNFYPLAVAMLQEFCMASADIAPLEV